MTTCPDHWALHRFIIQPISHMDTVSIQYKVYLQLQYQWHQRVAVNQLQYRWHQCVAVTDNYNTEDTNKWHSQTTYKWTTSQSMINLCTLFTNWINHGSRCTKPYYQYQSYYSPYQRETGASNEAQESQLNQKDYRLTCPLLIANVNTNYLRLL